GALAVAIARIDPVRDEPPVLDRHLHLEQLAANRARIALRADRFGGRRPARTLAVGGIELPEVEKGDLGLRQRSHLLADVLLRTQIAQHAVAGSVPRYSGELLPDARDEALRPGVQRAFQIQRIHAGEPPDRARQVDVLDRQVAAVAFHHDADAGLAGPAGERLP